MICGWEKMKKLNFVAALTTHDNDYQIEQAAAAKEAARRLGVDLSIVFAGNDGSVQGQQILNLIQAGATRPDGIIFEPAGGTALPQTARAAVAAGIAWVVLNRDVDYLPELRKAAQAPAFAVTCDHEEIGRIQGRQFAALLPQGGSTLYITGPSDSLAAKQRSAGIFESKPADVQVKLMKAQWTEAGAYSAVSSWLRLSTSQRTHIDVVAAQSDAMAMGAKRAFEDLPEGPARERWLSLPFLGCDGIPAAGQAWVTRRSLAATVIVPPNANHAVELLVHAINKTGEPQERNLTMPASFPPLDTLRASCEDETRSLFAGA
jgi:ribose transport system substrate-binding protein